MVESTVLRGIGAIMVMGGLAHAGAIPAEWLNLGGRKSDVQWTAQWVWLDGEAAPRNLYACARRDFDWTAGRTECRLHITADTRYRLYLNGEWIGDGPARSFSWAQQYDTYDVTGLLREGGNTIAVLVTHFGEGTFQYDPSGQAGLLVQLEKRNGNAWAPVVITDGQWRMRPHDGYLRPTMRLSCQQPFEEIVDGRRMPGDWMMPAFDARDWPRAKVVGPAGCPPWKTLVARSVPFYTREPVAPVRLWRTGLVELPSFRTGLTPRPYLLPGYKMQNHQKLNGFAATILESPADQTVTIAPRETYHESLTINGRYAARGEPVALKKGENLCMIVFQPRSVHEFDRTYAVFVEKPVSLKGVFQSDTAWTIFGPFESWPEVYEKVKGAKTAADLEPYKDAAQSVKTEDILSNGSAYEETTGARSLPGEPRIDNVNGLFGGMAEVTTVHPAERGCPELFLDFGREVVGHIEFDVDAAAGTVLSFNFIEEIEDGVRIHYANDHYAGVRYICRNGRQRFTSFTRKGYRYCKLVISEMRSPVRLRGVRTIFACQPDSQQGSFSCSDALLTRIWEIGRHTLRCCSEDTYTDCPLYEQTFWVGDARNEAMVDYASFGNGPLARRCAELPALSLFRQPLIECQVPSAWDCMLTAWSFLWVQAVDEYYWYSGDREYLAGVFPAVVRQMRNCREKLTDKNGLLSIEAWNMFDWAGQDSGHAVVTHNQMFLAEALRRTASMARVLGREDDAAYADGYRADLIQAINANLWDETKGAYADSIHRDGKLSSVVSQQTNSLALLYDVAPPERAARIRSTPVAPPEGMVKVGSPFALFYILEALAKDGRHAEVLAITRDRWGEMVKHGATTFWETFPGYIPNWWTRSYCHAWSAAPTYFLTRYQLGAWWGEPGYKTARIAPVPVDLAWAKGSVPTPHGPIRVAWERSVERFVIDVSLPSAVAATVELPVSAAEFTRVEAKGLSPRQVNDRWLIELPAGGQASITASK